MSSLAQAKTLGGIGSILVLLSVIPYAGMVIGLVGLILILVAVKYISDVFKDKSIFNNMLISVILGIAGIVIGIIVGVVFLFSYFKGFPEPFEASMFMGEQMYSFIIAILLVIIPIWIFTIISAVFLRKSYNSIASKLNIGMFNTVGLLYLIGAVLAIVFIGLILLFVAEILQAVAFFSIPEQAQQPQQTA